MEKRLEVIWGTAGVGRRQVSASSCGVRVVQFENFRQWWPSCSWFSLRLPQHEGELPQELLCLPWTLAYLCTNAIGNNTSPGFTWKWSKSWGCIMKIFGSLMPRAYAIALASVQHRIPIRLEAGTAVHQRYQERPWRVLLG